MRVYVESNYVLELVFGQEQWQSCESILDMAEAGSIELAIPALSLIEPYQRIVRRQRDREQLRRSLDQERAEVARVSAYQDPADQLQSLATFLLSSSQRDQARMLAVRGRILAACQVTPLDAPVLVDATNLAERFGLSPEDAAVLASVRADMAVAGTLEALFLTRNSKDFKDPDIQAFIGCRILFDFDDGLSLIRTLVS